jgi:hypothetical protein
MNESCTIKSHFCVRESGLIVWDNTVKISTIEFQSMPYSNINRFPARIGLTPLTIEHNNHYMAKAYIGTPYYF